MEVRLKKGYKELPIKKCNSVTIHNDAVEFKFENKTILIVPLNNFEWIQP